MNTTLIIGWSAHELKFSGLSWPTLEKPFWLDVGNTFLSQEVRFRHVSENRMLHEASDGMLISRVSGGIAIVNVHTASNVMCIMYSDVVAVVTLPKAKRLDCLSYLNGKVQDLFRRSFIHLHAAAFILGLNPSE